MVINSIIIQQAAIGDYLFLILIVVASIIQAISQNKKKKALQEMTQKNAEQADQLMPDVLDKKSETMKGYDSPMDNIFDSIQKMIIPESKSEEQIWGDDYPEPAAEKKNDSADESFSLSEEKLMHKIEERHNELITPKPVTENQTIRYKSRLRDGFSSVSYTHLRAHETRHDLVCRLLLEKKKK